MGSSLHQLKCSSDVPLAIRYLFRSWKDAGIQMQRDSPTWRREGKMLPGPNSFILPGSCQEHAGPLRKSSMQSRGVPDTSHMLLERSISGTRVQSQQDKCSRWGTASFPLTSLLPPPPEVSQWPCRGLKNILSCFVGTHPKKWTFLQCY